MPAKGSKKHRRTPSATEQLKRAAKEAVKTMRSDKPSTVKEVLKDIASGMMIIAVVGLSAFSLSYGAEKGRQMGADNKKR